MVLQYLLAPLNDSRGLSSCGSFWPSCRVKFRVRVLYLSLLENSCLCFFSRLSEEHQMAIQEYFRTSICLDAEQVQNGNSNLPGLKKLIMTVCKNLNRYIFHPFEYFICHNVHSVYLTTLSLFLWASEITRITPVFEIFHRTLDQQLSPGIGPKQVGGCLGTLHYYHHTQKIPSLFCLASFIYRFLPVQASVCPIGLSSLQNFSTP